MKTAFWLLASVLCLLITGCWSDYWGKKHFWNPQGKIEVFETVNAVTNAFPTAATVSHVIRTNVNLNVRWTPAKNSGGYPVDKYEVIITVREHTTTPVGDGWGPRAIEATYQVK